MFLWGWRFGGGWKTYHQFTFRGRRNLILCVYKTSAGILLFHSSKGHFCKRLDLKFVL